MGTTGIEPACRRVKRTNQILIAVNEFDYCFAHLLSIRLNKFSRLRFCSICFGKWTHLAITTRSKLRALMLWWRKVSLMILLTRFRSVALGNSFLLAIIPSLAIFFSFWMKNTLKHSSKIFSAWITWLKLSLRSNLCATVNFVEIGEILNSKSCTAPGAARPDNRAATACLHSNQKSMGTFPFGYWRLVSSFHVLYPWQIVKLRITKP